MRKKILIISSDKTGHGHKSIAEAVCAHLEPHSSTIDWDIVNGFELGGYAGRTIEALYSPITKRARWAWKLYYRMTNRNPGYMNTFAKLRIEQQFLKLIEETKPSVILTVHPGFVGSVIDILEEHKIDIPVITLIADMVSISNMWIDRRSQYIICPNEEVKKMLLALDIPAEKVKVFGFPVREAFCNAAAVENGHNSEIACTKDKVKFLIVNGCERRSRIRKIARLLLENFDCHLTIIAGRDTRLKQMLDRDFLGRYSERVDIRGYTTNMEDYMTSCDVLITRGGPNILMEAVTCCIPVIITGALPGQEAENPDFMVRNNLGLYCGSPDDIPATVNMLLKNNNELLNRIRTKQQHFRKPGAVRDIVSFLVDVVNQ